VEAAEEFLLIIKTMKARLEAVQSAIRELHSYELPECIAIEIEGGSVGYLNWIADSVK
jgi:periplasmic divalent cation tolerance protein